MNYSVKRNMGMRRSAGLGKSSKGTSMIEVLIAVLILGIGLLGIAAMQAVTLRNGQSSLERSQAVMQGYGVFDSMRSNMISARANGYNLARTCAVPAANATQAQRDLGQWITGIQATLGPNACGTVNCVSNVCTVTVDWLDSRGTRGSSTVPLQIIMRSRI